MYQKVLIMNASTIVMTSTARIRKRNGPHSNQYFIFSHCSYFTESLILRLFFAWQMKRILTATK